MEVIKLQTHNKQWKKVFSEEEKLIREAMGKVMIRVHHVGSTAVPDLLAKPIIDIAVESSEFPPTQDIINRLSLIGYENKGESGVSGRFWFIKGQPRKFNLHFCSNNSDIVNRQIAFRNKLIAYESLRREYEQVKLNNYVNRDIDDTEYALSKSDIIYKVINGADR